LRICRLKTSKKWHKWAIQHCSCIGSKL